MQLIVEMARQRDGQYQLLFKVQKSDGSYEQGALILHHIEQLYKQNEVSFIGLTADYPADYLENMKKVEEEIKKWQEKYKLESDLK